MKRSTLIRSLSLGSLVLAAPWVAAHTGNTTHVHDGLSALAMGFVHPFTGLDHLTAMVALGAWSALAASRRVWVAPLAFASTLLIGALVGLAGIAVPGVEPMIAASLLVLGLLLATRTALPAVAGAGLAAVFALFHGAAHGNELAGPGAALAITGMVLATALLHGAGIAIGLALRQRAVWMPRVAGAGVALFGAALIFA
jgi:urease accessory protein